MQTLREQFTDDTRTKTLRLYHTTGEFIARLPIEEVLAQYGDWLYWNAYSESFTEVSVWITNHATK
jgi:hypothetical protein